MSWIENVNKAIDAAIEADDATTKCDGCNGSGTFYGAGRVENGKFIGFSGQCFRCGGKGHQTPADVKRNTYYDNHVRRIPQ